MKRLLIFALTQLLIFTTPFSQALAEPPPEATVMNSRSNHWWAGALTSAPVLSPIGTSALQTADSTADQDSLRMKEDSTGSPAALAGPSGGRGDTETLLIVMVTVIVLGCAALYISHSMHWEGHGMSY